MQVDTELLDNAANAALTALISKMPFYDTKGEYGTKIDSEEITIIKRDLAKTAYEYASYMMLAREDSKVWLHENQQKFPDFGLNQVTVLEEIKETEAVTRLKKLLNIVAENRRELSIKDDYLDFTIMVLNRNIAIIQDAIYNNPTNLEAQNVLANFLHEISGITQYMKLGKDLTFFIDLQKQIEQKLL